MPKATFTCEKCETSGEFEVREKSEEETDDAYQMHVTREGHSAHRRAVPTCVMTYSLTARIIEPQ